jgi:spore maturation protein CgeB
MWDTKNLPPDELAYVAKRLRPDLVMSINYQKGLAEGCEGLRLPLVVWEIDPALDHLQPCQTDTGHCQIFTWRKTQTEDWKRAGFKNVHHLPLAANHHRRTPGLLTPAESRYRASVSFVGSSLTDTLAYCRSEFVRCWQEWSGRKETEEPIQILDYIVQFHQTHPSIYVVDDMLARRCPGLESHARDGASPNMLVGELVAHRYRRQVVEALAPFGIRVWGDEGWRGVDSRGGRFMGPASHNHDVTRVYRGSMITIDVGRRYQRDIVTMRVFDVLACGGFVLAEDCDDLRACFEPGVHLDTWSTIDELVDKTEWYRQHPDKVAQIREAGHQHLLNAHTIDQRMSRLLQSLAPELVV